MRVPMTLNGFNALKIELEKLKTVDRIKIIQAIADARALGDLSENAEYHAAREKQGFIESRITEIESKISKAEIIDVSKIVSTKITFGSYVKLLNEEKNKNCDYQIVGEEEADASNGKISINSPLSRALIGKEIGDVVDVNAPNGKTISYEILSICYK
jgi:transcription elongation factor GreA